MKLEEYLRTEYYNYIRPLFIKSNCENCNSDKNLELHHIKQFSDMLQETLQELKLEYKSTKDYTNIELQNISYIMIGKQIKYKNITLCKKCHKEYHGNNLNFTFTDNKLSRYQEVKDRNKYDNEILIPYLNNILNKTLYDKTELINIFNINTKRNYKCENVDTLNKYLKENNFDFKIIEKSMCGTKFWIVRKNNYSYNK